jgi:hypothetical protein
VNGCDDLTARRRGGQSFSKTATWRILRANLAVEATPAMAGDADTGDRMGRFA